MNEEFKGKLILTIIDKLLFGLVVGIVVLIGQYYITLNIEKRKSVLSYQSSIAQIRADNIQKLWYATYTYGRKLAGVLRSDNLKISEEDLLREVQTFEHILGQTGVFIGREKVVSIDERIGMRFIVHLTEVIASNDPDKLFKTLNKFQNDWILIQQNLEKELKTCPNI